MTRAAVADHSAAPEQPPLLQEQRGNVLVLTLNRPHVRNAIDLSTAEAMAAALDRLDAEDELRAGVLCGSGSGFCAGMDLKAFAADGHSPRTESRGFAGIVRRPSVKPLIAAVEGFAVAGGLEIALACDLIVAARGARLGLPEVKRGLVAAGGGLRRLPRRLPGAIAAELALTGELILAERAYELGAVNRLCEPGGALEAALELAEAIAVNAPLATRATNEILRRQADWEEDEFWERQAEVADPVVASEDAREGARAFSERRAPRWQGR